MKRNCLDQYDDVFGRPYETAKTNPPFRTWRGFILWLAVFVILLLVLGSMGCKRSHPAPVPNSIPAVGSSVEKATAHVESAGRLVGAAKPRSDETGKELLTAAEGEHGSALTELSTARTQLVDAQEERDQVLAELDDTQTELTEVKSGWGYRLQVWVRRVLNWLVFATFLHFALGAVALFVPGTAGAWMARIATFVNPFAWFQGARDAYWYRVQKDKYATPANS